MRYKRTVEIVDKLFSYGIDRVKMEKKRINSYLLRAGKNPEYTDLTYFIDKPRSWIIVSINEEFLEIAICKTQGLIARVYYKLKDGRYVFDSTRSRNYTKLSKVHETLLLPELELVMEEYEDSLKKKCNEDCLNCEEYERCTR